MFQDPSFDDPQLPGSVIWQLNLMEGFSLEDQQTVPLKSRKHQ